MCVKYLQWYFFFQQKSSLRIIPGIQTQPLHTHTDSHIHSIPLLKLPIYLPPLFYQSLVEDYIII